ncbi:MAG: molybdopterin dinucleotide binding domain-containing protein, partial [Acidobacteriota bacterium]
VKKRLKAIRERGGRLVVVDPRHTETARLADEHLAIRPGTDALLLAALLHTVFAEALGGAESIGHLGAITDGVDTLRAVVEPFPPERVADATGIDAATIRQLARDFAAAERAVAYGRMGTSTQEFGTLCQWLVQSLNLVTGNLDRVGGGMFTQPAIDIVGRGHGGGSYGRWRSRVRGLPEFGGELPVATLAEDILAEASDDDDPDASRRARIQALITVAGNPVLSTPNGRRLETAIRSLDFRVAIDLYVNETTRHADVILPPTPPLEHEHYDLVFHALAIRDTARFSPPLFEPPTGALHDWQILLELERRLVPNPPAKFRLGRAVRGWLGPSGLIDLGLRTGPHGAGLLGLGRGLTLGRLKRQPHGVDLGALGEGRLAERLRAADRRLDTSPDLLVADLGRLAERLDELSSPDTLVLIGRRQVRSNNSWMHNYSRLMRGADRCTVMLHPDDADRFSVADGATVRVRSRVGEVTAPAEVTDTIRPGVISLPHGFGHGRQGARLRVADASPGVSINDLTDEARIDAVSGNTAFSGVPVTVEAVRADTEGARSAAGG